MQAARALHPVVQRRAFEHLRAIDAYTTWLERAHTRRNDYRTRIERGTRSSADMETSVLLAGELDDLLPKMKRRVKRLDLLHEPVHELLRTAYGLRRDVVNGLFRIELGALPPGMLQRIDQVGADSEQPQLEDLKQTARTGADDDHFGGKGLSAQNSDFQARAGQPL